MKTKEHHPPPISAEFLRREKSTRPLIGLAVGMSESEHAVSLTVIHAEPELNIRHRTETVHHVENKYVLSLPAAAQLARDLDRCVQEYLYGTEGTE